MANARIVPDVCHRFNALESGCTEYDCRELHICYNFVMGSCQSGVNCKKTHLLSTIHNTYLLRTNGWESKNQHSKILSLLRERFQLELQNLEEDIRDSLKTLKVCHTYNVFRCASGCCRDLHLCEDFVMNKCTRGRECHLDHDLVKSYHNIRVLRRAKLADVEPQRVVDILQGKFTSVNKQQIKKLSKKNKKAEATQKERSAQGAKMKTAQSEAKGTKIGNSKSQDIPRLCTAYNTDVCDSDSCPFLHVCSDYVISACKKKGKCFKEHNVYQGIQNVKVLRKTGLLNKNKNEIYSKIHEGYKASAAAYESDDESSAGTAYESDDESSDGSDCGAARCSLLQAGALASLTCVVCLEPFVRATRLSCSHTFCEDCVRGVDRQGQPCPLCRAPITRAVRAPDIDQTVAEYFALIDEEAQRARRQLEMERCRAVVVPRPLADNPAFPNLSETSWGDLGRRIGETIEENFGDIIRTALERLAE